LKSIIVLGSTGSIGVNTLKIAKRFGIEVEGLAAGGNVELLNAQIDACKPKFVAIGDKEKKHLVNHENIFCGDEGIVEIIRRAKSQTVVNALVGFSGVMPSLECMTLGKKLALANKESLVVAGKFLDTDMIHPIDSEHFGLWYLQNDKAVNKLYITASGGALRDWPVEAMETATVTDVLNHPNWSMGSKITVDSATMVNKLFEIVEAKWLFKTSDIDALIEPKSIIHALIEFCDGSTTAHMADVDMALPIAYALDEKIDNAILRPIDLCQMGALQLEAISQKRYPLWGLKQLLLQNIDLGVVFNAANDLLVAQFLNKQISYSQLVRRLQETVYQYEDFSIHCSSDLQAAHTMIQKKMY